jgi:DNA helicase-2/ATP-dependent DNA helicase PcrA
MRAEPVATLDFTAEQLGAIRFPLAPLRLVAGAGTGKTTVMAQRIFDIIQSGGATDFEVLGLTFTNKAALNLKQKVRAALERDADVTIATYHSFGASLVAEHGLELGLDRGTQVLNRAQAWQLLFAVFDEFRFHKRGAMLPRVILDDALALASRCADYLVPIQSVADDCARLIADGKWKGMRAAAEARLELCQVVAAYDRRKRERNLIDYGDQIRLAVRLLEGNPDLAAGLRAQHPVVLLDEYQDTNFAQRRMLQAIYPPGSAITVVGDDMQSIYAFRGAHLYNLQHFPDHFPPEETRRLQATFRFGPELVTLANRIQANVPNSLEKELSAAPGRATTIECFLASDDAEEAETIAAEIATRGAPWRENAVLCRKRRLISAIVAALDRHEVPVEVVGASGLLDRPEIVDLVAWLEVLADPAASVPLLRVLEGPRYRIGRHDLTALARHLRVLADTAGIDPHESGLVLADALTDSGAVADLSDAARTRLRAFVEERDTLGAAALRLPVLDLAETIILRTGLWHASGPRGRQNLLRFLDLASRFTPVEGDPGLHAFLEYLQLLDDSEEDIAEFHSSEDDTVKVMTIHQAKGLEFDSVYVPGLAGSRSSYIFPDTRAGDNALTTAAALPWWLREDEGDIPDWHTARSENEVTTAIRARKRAEEWRLFYVACTRAERRLVCSAAHWYPGPTEPQGPSELYEFVASQPDVVTERFRHDPPETDPQVAARERQRAAHARRYDPPVASDPGQLSLDQVPAPADALAPARRAPSALSVTALVSYRRCPKQFYWSVVRPLPRQSSVAARVGTEVHRWIELRSGRQLALIEPEPETELDGDTVAGGGAVAGLKRAFVDSPFGALDPRRVEAPFVLPRPPYIVRGRIDAVYQRDGRTELVDFKTGREPDAADPSADVQLDLYAIAAVDTWGDEAAGLRTTYCYLRADGTSKLVTREWSDARLATARAELDDALRRLDCAQFDVNPGPWCPHCDFVDVCPTGREWTADSA